MTDTNNEITGCAGLFAENDRKGSCILCGRDRDAHDNGDVELEGSAVVIVEGTADLK